MRRKRKVSNWATRHIERFGIETQKPPHQPISAGVEEEAELIGGRLGAGRAVRREMGLPVFDVVFGLAAPAIEVFVKAARVALPEIGDDEAGVGSFLVSLIAQSEVRWRAF